MPPFPLPNTAISSRVAYLRRNLGRYYGQRLSRAMLSQIEFFWGFHLRGTYHPPGSAMAESWASMTFASSKPFSDIAVGGGGWSLLSTVSLFDGSSISGVKHEVA